MVHNHYVPQYYLKGFCEPATPSILAVYEKGSRKGFTTTVKNLAQQRDLYPDETEKFLATQIEQPANLVLDKIRDRTPISIEDKAALAAYMMAMMKRVPRSRERLQAAAPKVLDSVFARIDRAMTRLVAKDPSKSVLLMKRREESEQIRARFESSFPDEIWHQLIPPHTAPRALDALSSMTWQFLTFDTETAFMTSDNPVFFFEGMGIGNQDSEVTFPISRHVVLWATWRPDLEECFRPTSRRIVREVNSRTVSAATRYVFYARKVKWVTGFVNCKTFLLNRIV